MLPSQELAEGGVAMITTAVLTLGLGSSSGAKKQADGDILPLVSPGNLWLAAMLACLTAAAMLAESAGSSSWGQLYLQRTTGSSGLALGALALPWVFVGLTIQWQHVQTLGQPAIDAAGASFTAAACSASSLLLLLLQLWGSRQAGALWNGSSRHMAAEAALLGWRGQLCAATLLLVLGGSAAAAALLTGSYQASAALLVVTAAAAGSTHLLLALLPCVFTLGEAILASQAAALLGRAALLDLLDFTPAAANAGPYRRFVVLLSAGSVLVTALLIPLLLCCQQAQQAANTQRRTRSSTSSSGSGGSSNAWAAAAIVATVATAAVTPAVVWAIRFALSSRRRLLLCAWWVADLTAALPAQHWVNCSGRVPAILVRKGYHLLAVSLFLPALLLEPQLLGVALAAAFALLLAVEALRLSGVPGIAPRLHAFMTSFTDGRDSGLLLVTHLTLLLGMAAPVWLSNALHAGALGAAGSVGAAAAGSVAVWPAAFAGIFVIGLGDTAASAVGSLFGRRPICHGSCKTVEGTAAAVAATLAGWWLLAVGLGSREGVFGGSRGGRGEEGVILSCMQLGGWGWVQLAVATALSCLLEAATTQLDNIFVPLHYFALLCLL